jgi:SAM-dependent methyltransferase
MPEEDLTSQRFGNRLIKFYGGEYPEIFEIERRCMDRDGKVIQFLDEHLPTGLILDIGAGNGFTAACLKKPGRTIIPMEPDPLMVDRSKPFAWTKGVAQEIPFHDHVFDGAYATWAFFFDGIPDILQGLSDTRRVVKPGGTIIIVDNAGGDEFCSFSKSNIACNQDWWKEQGFEDKTIHTSYRFDSIEEANTLLSFYFGEESAQKNHKTEIEYNAAVFMMTVR